MHHHCCMYGPGHGLQRKKRGGDQTTWSVAAPFKVLSLVVFAQSRAFSSTTIWLMVHECMWLEGICVQHSVASTAISRCLQVITIAVKNHCNSDVWWYYMWSLVTLDDVVGWLVKGSNKKGAMCLGVFSDAPRYNSWGLVKNKPRYQTPLKHQHVCVLIVVVGKSWLQSTL